MEFIEERQMRESKGVLVCTKSTIPSIRQVYHADFPKTIYEK